MFPLRRAGLAVGSMDRWGVNLLGRLSCALRMGRRLRSAPESPSPCLRSLPQRPGSGCRATGSPDCCGRTCRTRRPRAILRQAPAATRRLAPFLEADAGSIGFSAGMVETDLAAFEAAIAEDTPAALERAAGLYRADLLDGFSLRDRDFDDWLTGERERLREHAVQLSCA